MKKIIAIILVVVSFKAGAQIDTVLVRGATTLRADVWAWSLGKYKETLNADSATRYHYNRVAGLLLQAKPQIESNGWGHQVAMDSIPGFILKAIYSAILTSNAGEVASKYTAVINELEGKSNLLPYLTPLKTATANDFDRFRDIGRWIAQAQPNL